MLKREIVSGQVFQGGRVLRKLAPDGQDHQRVKFLCSACRKHGKCRFSDLYQGRQGPCGCLRDAAFLKHLGSLASELTPQTRTEIWEYGELHLLPATVARYHDELDKLRIPQRLQKALLNFVWRTEGARVLAAVPSQTRTRLYASMQRKGLRHTAETYAVSPALVLRIHRANRQGMRAVGLRSRMSRSQAFELAHAGNCRIDDARSNGYQAEWYRPRNEFSKKELTGKSRASRNSLRAAYEVLKVIPGSEVPGRYRVSVEAFLGSCDHTLQERTWRYNKYNAKRHQALMTELFPMPGDWLESCRGYEVPGRNGC